MPAQESSLESMGLLFRVLQFEGAGAFGDGLSCFFGPEGHMVEALGVSGFRVLG